MIEKFVILVLFFILFSSTVISTCTIVSSQYPTLWVLFDNSFIDSGIYSSCGRIQNTGSVQYIKDGTFFGQYFAYFNNPGLSNSMSNIYLVASTYNNAPLSILVWIKTDLSYYMTALGLCTFSNLQAGIQIDIYPSGTVIAYLALPYRWSVEITASTKVNAKSWFHIGLTISSSYVCTLYLNGLVVGTGVGTGNLNNYDSLVIGGSGDKYRGFSGYMKDLRMYNYVLTQSDVLVLKNMYNPTISPTTSRPTTSTLTPSSKPVTLFPTFPLCQGRPCAGVCCSHNDDNEACCGSDPTAVCCSQQYDTFVFCCPQGTNCSVTRNSCVSKIKGVNNDNTLTPIVTPTSEPIVIIGTKSPVNSGLRENSNLLFKFNFIILHMSLVFIIL